MARWPFLPDLRFFGFNSWRRTEALANVIKLGPAHRLRLNQFNLFNIGTMEWKYALDTNPRGDLAHRKSGVDFLAMLAGQDDTLKNLNTLPFFARFAYFFNALVHAYNVTRTKDREILL